MIVKCTWFIAIANAKNGKYQNETEKEFKA